MSEIKRYDLDEYEDQDGGLVADGLAERADGDWVRYEDHAADRAALVAQLEAIQQAVRVEIAPESMTDSQALSNCQSAIRTIRLVLDNWTAHPNPTHAALVAQVAELTRERNEAQAALVEMRSEAARLSRERNEARAQLHTVNEWRVANRAEVTRLTEALAAAETGVKLMYPDEAHAYLARAVAAEARVRELEDLNRNLRQDVRDAAPEERLAREKAESEVANLRAEYNRQVELSVAARNEAADLRAEVERLRAGQEPPSITAEYWMRRAKESESACLHWSEESQHNLQRANAAESRLAAANALLEDTAALSYCPTWLKTAIRAHLAAQPATAPAHQMAGTELNQYDEPATAPCEHKFVDLAGKRCCYCGADKPATAPARTEGEQAVLDAIGRSSCWRTGTGRAVLSASEEAAEAELARRGLK